MGLQSKALFWSLMGGSSLQPETRRLLTSFPTQPTPERVAAYDRLFVSLKASGLTSKLSSLWLHAAHSDQAARIDILNPGSHTATGTATFSVDTGFTGNGSSYYINLNLNPANDSVMSQDSGHVGTLLVGTNAQSATWSIGADIASGQRWLIQARTTSDTTIYRASDTTQRTVSGTYDSRGHWILNRTASNARALAKNGYTIDTDTQASAAEVSANLITLAYNTTTSFSSRTISFAHAGAGLNSSDLIALHSALMRYCFDAGVIPAIDVFLVAGQSNGVHGGAGAPAITKAWNYGAAANYTWHDLATSGEYSAIGTSITGSLWPSFANAWYSATGRVPVFANVCRGSTALLAAADTGSGNWSPTGALRSAAVSSFNAAIQAVTGIGYINSRNVVWIQGEQDAIQHNGTTITGALYRDALAALASYFDSNIVGGIDEMMVIQTGAHRDGLYTTGFGEIRTAQNDACATSNKLRLISTLPVTFVGLGYMDDTLHYTQTGMNSLGSDAAGNASIGVELAV